jgi:hypothetical protein
MIQFYCINLQRRKDRWGQVSKEFKNHGLDVKRWNAVDALEVGVSGPFACAASHILLMKYASILGVNEMVVFEDDVVLKSNFWNLLCGFIGEAPSDMQFLNLHSYNAKQKRPLGNICAIEDCSFGTHGYYVRRNAIKIISGIEVLDRCLEDRLFSTLRNNGFVAYGLDDKNTIAFQNGDDSDIPETSSDAVLASYKFHMYQNIGGSR